MISLGKFLSHDNEAEATLLHVVRILIEGIGANAAEGDIDDGAQFRESIHNISAAITKDVTPAQLLVHAGSVLKALEDHTRRAARRRRLQTTEFQHMVKMLTSTIGVVSAASNANVGRLGEIEKQVATTSELDNVREIKTRLSECLSDIRSEAERQRKETDDTIQQLSQGLDNARLRAANPSEADSQDVITGLPTRKEAETALAQAARSGIQTYAAVMVLDRLQMMNTRFGREAGDEILRAFTEMVQQRLTPTDRFFRWSGPVLVALLPRNVSLEMTRIAFNRVMETRLEHTIQTQSRSILIPISARWTLFPMMAAPRLMYQKIDSFSANPSPRE